MIYLAILPIEINYSCGYMYQSHGPCLGMVCFPCFTAKTAHLFLGKKRAQHGAGLARWSLLQGELDQRGMSDGGA